MHDFSNLFWNTTLDELTSGYVYEPEAGIYTCLICGETFEKGRIYSVENLYYDAQKTAEKHMATAHSSMFDYLINMDKRYTGLTEHQKNIMTYFYNGYSDKEITALLGGSASTIRNYRFSFREKEKQAKVFLAIMHLLEKCSKKEARFIDFQPTVTMVDDRYAITGEEYENIIKMYFKEGPDGPLSTFPGKEKRKIAVLKHLLNKFATSRKYTEQEVNAILKSVYHDYVTLRRYLIAYGFMDRARDGSEYWVKT